ncbi:hypothetical protein O181_048040 [Austropuccinia psidii MF-1]|uniref:Ty3 transposon capsid-like protein domain-containing protein n=1 Tax=Austropuccinia psidii MF-1 TaxID=1389203 RepID=A0A9Q3DWG9_9BASI|nr:hypothetical protein [Austropuccinia psidii MF-1]
MEGEGHLQKRRLGEAEDEEGEASKETESETALAGVPEASEAANLAHYNQQLVSQAEPNFLKIMEQMTQLMGQLTQEITPRDNSKAPVLKTPSMKVPDYFDGTQAHKLRGLFQYFQLISHNDPENFFSDWKKVLYSTSFLTARAGKWSEPYLPNISNEDPSYLLQNWQLFKTQLFTLFGDPNEVNKAEQDLDNLMMKQSVHVPLYIDDFKILRSRIGYWAERAYIHFYRRGLASKVSSQLASHPGTSDTLQELMDIILVFDTRCHERKKEKGGNTEKKPPLTGSYFPRPPQD